VLSVLANDRLLDGMAYNALLRTDGMIFLAFFIIFLYYSFTIGPGPAMTVKEKAALPRLPFAVVQVFAGLAGLVLGGKWIVDGAVFIAVKLGMSESLVGLSIVAVGTSLPELATSAIAAYKKNVEIAVGNVVGSNIFNIFFVLGVSSVIKPLPFNTSANIDIGVLMLANILLFISMFTGARRIIDRWEGGVFLGLYAGYIAWRAAMG
jgi:cation:H+ antiporter